MENEGTQQERDTKREKAMDSDRGV